MDNPMWGPDWDNLRALWPLENDVMHLNHGSFGAPATPVLEAQDQFRIQLTRNPDRFFRRQFLPLLDEARLRAARFCGAEPECFTLVSNNSTGINAVLNSLNLNSEDHVLITNHAYEGVKRAAQRMSRQTGSNLTTIRFPLGIPDADLVASFMTAVRAQTRVAIIDHISCRTATLLPIQSLIGALHDAGVMVVVDAAHAPGMIDINLQALKPDFWVGSFHKWAGAPHAGSGLYVAPWMHTRIQPLIAQAWLDGKLRAFPDSFVWPGTFDPTALLSIPAALDFMNTIGWKRLRIHNARLADYGRRVVARALGTLDISAAQPSIAMALVALPEGIVSTPSQALELEGLIAEALNAELTVVTWDNAGWIRLSAQVYNAPEEYDSLADNLPALLHQPPRFRAPRSIKHR